ncbi:MAG: helix-turn-helix transcriptional regulator [Deltaproteobacteria bacterium]|nr:helix-turn-helix transcriptional regulator [Deltaproteobacteria bacterium]
MRPAVNLAAFEAEPAGHCLAGKSWLHWCAGRGLFGVHLWGRPDEDDVRALVRSLAVELGEGVSAHESLVDASGVEGVDLGAFSVLNEYVTRHHARLTAQVTRLALVRPGGMEGAVVAGFFQVLEAPYPVKVFDDDDQALAWLGGTPPSSLLADLHALQTQLTGVDPLVRSLRPLLAASLIDVDVDAAARGLGVSERTLQRRLQEVGTTFVAELTHVRLEESKRRMLDSEAPLTAISLDVGFSSLQHFSAVFRKSTGETPSAWRKTRKTS